MSATRLITFLASLNGFCAVLLGALGAHALRARLSAQGTLESWQTAAQYHLAHAVASIALLAWASAQAERAPRLLRVAWLWQLGCLLFAGSIYLLALDGPRFLGPVTPLGGLAFLAGWALLAAESLRRPPSA